MIGPFILAYIVFGVLALAALLYFVRLYTYEKGEENKQFRDFIVVLKLFFAMAFMYISAINIYVSPDSWTGPSGGQTLLVIFCGLIGFFLAHIFLAANADYISAETKIRTVKVFRIIVIAIILTTFFIYKKNEYLASAAQSPTRSELTTDLIIADQITSLGRARDGCYEFFRDDVIIYKIPIGLLALNPNIDTKTFQKLINKIEANKDVALAFLILKNRSITSDTLSELYKVSDKNFKKHSCAGKLFLELSAHPLLPLDDVKETLYSDNLGEYIHSSVGYVSDSLLSSTFTRLNSNYMKKGIGEFYSPVDLSNIPKEYFCEKYKITYLRASDYTRINYKTLNAEILQFCSMDIKDDEIITIVPTRVISQEGVDQILDGRIREPRGENKCKTGYENDSLMTALQDPNLPQEAYNKVVSLIETGKHPRLFLFLLRNEKTKTKEVLELNDIYKQKYTNNCGEEILEDILTHPYTPIKTVEEYLLNDEKYIRHSYVLKLLFVTDKLAGLRLYGQREDSFHDAHKLNIENTCAKIKLAYKHAFKRLPKGFPVVFSPKERYEAAKSGPCKEFWDRP